MSSSGGGVPFYLMPVAAFCGTYFALATIRTFYIIYCNLTHKAEATSIPPTPIKSKKFVFLLISIVISVFSYGYIVGQVESALLEDSFANSVFDPYDILTIPTNATTAEVKSAFRSLSKIHHPDKGGDERLFHHITLAYKALTDPVGKQNYEQFGHPDGKPSSPTLKFALPDWLLHPEGKVAIVLLLMYLGLFLGIILYVVSFVRKTEQKRELDKQTNSVAGFDINYLANKLSPESTHWEILFYIATTPENIEVTSKNLERIESMKKDKLERTKKKQEESNLMSFDDDGGWADDEEDESEKALKKAEELKKKEMQNLNNTMGKKPDINDIMLEGIDDGVIGQEWVLQRLTEHKVWPPTIPKDSGTFMNNATGKVSEALEHPAIKRNLIMTVGRLNATMLNSRADLAKSAATGKIDQTYFRGSLEFRQRCGLLLEAALRVAVSARSYRLAKTIVETVTMFKLGIMSANSEKVITFYRTNMEKQYGSKNGIPKLLIKNKSLETPGEDEMATGDALTLSIDVERVHAELFARAKIAICQKQGIPPQVALNAYREVWWVLVRAKRVDDGGKSEASDTSKDIGANSALSKVISDPLAIKRFEDEPEENRLLTAFPFMVSKIMKKDETIKVRFKAPEMPGKYTFLVSIMSQEFLGCNEEFEVADIDILDVEEVKRKEAEEEGEDEEKDKDDDNEDDDGSDEDEEEEAKKTK